MSCCETPINQRLFELTKLKLVASVVMIDEDERILIAKRPSSKDMSGLWEFPGGKVENKETPESALVREISEELNVKTCAGCLYALTFASYPYDNFHLLMPVYMCRKWEGIIQANEGQKLRWVKKENLKEYKMPKANADLINKLLHLI